jgi:hypothetical protein
MNNRIRNKIRVMIKNNTFSNMSILGLTKFLCNECPPSRKIIKQIMRSSRKGYVE